MGFGQVGLWNNTEAKDHSPFTNTGTWPDYLIIQPYSALYAPKCRRYNLKPRSRIPMLDLQRKSEIGIPFQRWTPCPTSEPIYL